MNENPLGPVSDSSPENELHSNPREADPSKPQIRGIARLWESLTRLGLGDTTLRVTTIIVAVLLFLMVVWVMDNIYLKGKANAQAATGGGANTSLLAAFTTATPTNSKVGGLPNYSTPSAVNYTLGISRLALLHTILPDRARFTVTTYTVQTGDTVYGIAEKFNLKPSSILWGNVDTLGADPELILPGQKINILPVDGAYHKWVAGEGLNAVASFFGVTVDDIINYPSNNLSKDTIGNLSNPNIKPGTMLIIPGGTGTFSDSSNPIVSRTNPATASIMGPGYCGAISYGAVGTGTFIWPSTEHYLSGYPFDPTINHFGVDEAGALGYPIYATDSGVVVYAGWNNLGYGNMIIIDHGNGWQSLYGHLSVVGVSCGESVAQGDTIGQMGSTGNSTGPHLHFELRSATYGRINPIPYFK